MTGNNGNCGANCANDMTGMTGMNGMRGVRQNCGCRPNAQQLRTCAPAADCASGSTPAPRAAELPTGDRVRLLSYLDEVSFAAYDAALYLDTHPDCREGLRYFREQNEARKLALSEYAKLYGPLTMTQAGRDCDSYWQWVNQPWPWEGGKC